MDNYDIVKVLQEMVTLMDLHGENPQKIKTYNNAIFNIERYEERLAEKTVDELQEIGGVGKGLAESIAIIASEGKLPQSEELKVKTPEGILEMISIRGVGAAKIKTAWNEKQVESPEAMLELAKSGEMTKLKGFGQKTVENILASLEFYLENKSKLLMHEGEEMAANFMQLIEEKDKSIDLEPTGELKNKSEVINCLSFISAAKPEKIKEATAELPLEWSAKTSGPQVLRGIFDGIYPIEIFIRPKESRGYDQLRLTASDAHLVQLREKGLGSPSDYKSMTTEEIYNQLSLNNIPEEHRVTTDLQLWDKDNELPELISMDHFKGMLHCHSTYSDGRNTLREMAEACIERGYEYFGICDHSKSAFFYANGMFENRVQQQHEEIDKLNEELKPFKIFKGIESDILTDGNLDYDEQFLNTFDFVVASVHSGLSMDIEKAMKRLLTAISNPHTTILGHLTGRILLQRPGFQVDHRAIIDACAENHVGIEINAHPSRLDLDWRWVKYAMDQGVMISINPDAHSVEGLDMTKYGVFMGRKAGLLKSKTLNAMSLSEIESYFNSLKEKRGIKS